MKRNLIFTVLVLLAGTVVAQSAFTLPKYEKYRLKNGLTVYLMEQHEVPVIYLNMVFRAGAVLDGERAGLASFTAEALKYGTENYTKSEIEETVDFLGSEFYTGAVKEYAYAYTYFNKRQQADILKVFGEVVRAPSFDSEEFEKGKKRKLARLKQAKESPRGVIDAYWDKFIYGTHPYGNTAYGDQTGVQSLTVEDLRAFYAAHFSPQDAAIAVVGDFKTADMKKRLDQMFKDWKGSKAKTRNAVAPINLEFDRSRVLLVNKNDSRETRFYIGGKGVPRDHPDYVGIQVINTILGGRFTSWLNAELRINSGLSYGARSRFSTHRLTGSFNIASFTKTATTVEAIDLALKVLARLHNEGPDEKTLSSAKNYIKGGFPTDYETSGELAALLTDFFIFGFDEDYIDSFQKKVDALDRKAAQEIIRKYFPKENLQFVLVGKGEEIREQIRKYGEITEKQITAPGY
ncbi:MAG: pitrilysin family protein [Bacteroidota bacterium]